MQWDINYRTKVARFNHGSIIRTGVTGLGGLLWKKLKHFEVLLNIFEFSQVWENLESWLVYVNMLFWIAQPSFLTYIIKRS